MVKSRKTAKYRIDLYRNNSGQIINEHKLISEAAADF